MADTLLSVAQRIARRIGINPTFTSFSNNDETNDLVGYINDAYQDLLDALPDDVPYLLDTNSTLTLSASTRLYSMDADYRHFSILEWSFANSTNDNNPIHVATLEEIQTSHPDYATDTGVPRYVYREGNEQVGFYPVPDGTYTITYKFSKPFSRLSATTDTFLVPDHWLRFVEEKAQYYYERKKGFVEANETYLLADQRLIGILTEAELMNPHGFYAEGE